MRAQGHPAVTILPHLDALPDALAGQIRAGDYVICLGAGDITTHAHGLVEKLTVQVAATA
jgi:UDP-N-acetylmuramate--alanine ligase